ncbi:MAG TPA: hypothetical protein VN085_09015, partial [Vicinamibacterales bacterium]|nr:hypothetical protein [Vicinamibacterales bacterium]
MTRFVAAFILAWIWAPVAPQQQQTGSTAPPEPDLKPIAVTSEGSARTAAGAVDYQTTLGTLVVHPKGWDDAAARDDKDNPAAVATMSYVAYFKKGADVS